MKKICLCVLLSGWIGLGMAQEEKKQDKEKSTGKFKKENLFTGGGINLSFSSYGTVMGASPVIGYSLNKWLDAALIINFNYSSSRHAVYYDAYSGSYYYSDDKLRQTIWGPGLLLRAYPVKFLFVQVQGEENFSSQKLIPADGSPTQKDKFSAASCLVGAGYCNGRMGPGSMFYYVSIMADVAKNRNSPYVEQLANGKVNVLPIIRAGIQVPLFQGKGAY
ncbi:MAG: hypothetical protein NTX08_09300 [Sphingobacteriales bacterium]|nr:hypothetical protein [Sphingobacteriales bacterium]